MVSAEEVEVVVVVVVEEIVNSILLFLTAFMKQFSFKYVAHGHQSRE